MNAPLYNRDILRLAASIPYHRRLTDAQASVEKRSATCGSSVTVDVCLDNEGRVANLGLEVRACALGQASASQIGSASCRERVCQYGWMWVVSVLLPKTRHTKHKDTHMSIQILSKS